MFIENNSGREGIGYLEEYSFEAMGLIGMASTLVSRDPGEKKPHPKSKSKPTKPLQPVRIGGNQR